MNATLFYIGFNENTNNSNYINKDNLNKVKKEYKNIDIASHTYNLHYQSDKGYNLVSEDYKKINDVINSKYFAYPYGDYNDNYIKALKDNNYSLAFRFGPDKNYHKYDIKNNNYKIPRLNISNEVPFWKFILRIILSI